MSRVTLAFDATVQNISHLPPGQHAGYTTGAGIAWSPADWAAHPYAVRICQDAGATDTTADVLDVESGAATPADCPTWYRAALANFDHATRPGQRLPAIYASLDNISNVINALKAGGVKSGPKLYVAHWGLSATAAQLAVTDVGAFPIVGIQWANNGLYDSDYFLTQWLQDRSAKHVPPPPPPPRTVKTGTLSLVYSDGGTQSITIP